MPEDYVIDTSKSTDGRTQKDVGVINTEYTRREVL